MMVNQINSQKFDPKRHNELNKQNKIVSNQVEEEVAAIIKKITLTTETNIYHDKKDAWIYRLIPYKIRLQLLAFLFKNPIVQKMLLSAQVKRIEQFVQLIQSFSGRKYDTREMMGLTLFRNYLKIHSHIVSSSLHFKFKELTKVSGMENFHTARSKERGIILVEYHNSLDKKTKRILFHKLFNTSIMSINGAHILKINKEVKLKLSAYFSENDPQLLDKKFMSYQYQMARDVLSRNGIVKIAGDGRRGTSAVQLSLFGKEVNLMQGFAELAVRTGASVLPVVSSIGYNGIINVKIYPSIYSIDSTISNDEQKNILLEKYLEFWSEELLSDPANYRPKRMERIVNLPDFK